MTGKHKPTRAEQLREKRERQPRRRKTESKHRSQSAVGNGFPPILVRGGVAASVSPRTRKVRSGRRRFDIAINGQGAEMRLPSIPTLGIGWRLISAFLIGALGFLIYLLWTSPFFTVESITVKGLGRLSNAELNAAAQVVGKSIIHVDPIEVEQNLEAAFPELEKISVQTEVPNKVMVSLVERKPVLAWQHEGQTYWVDQDGRAYLPRGDENPGIMVQGSGLLDPAAESDDEFAEGESHELSVPIELVNGILVLSQELTDNPSLTYDEEHGIGWFDPRGWQVYFGKDGQDMDLKWKVYWKTFKRLKKAGIIPAVISVEHVHAPYYRLEQ